MVSEVLRLNSWRSEIEASMGQWARELYPQSTRLHEACRYALEGQGKRIRPLLAFAAFAACRGSNAASLIPASLSLEWVHTYSLVHDDLPCMDNDDLRRGRPTTHKAFDEATALLVGDALLTDAFTLIDHTPELADSQKLALILTLSRAAGGQGMVYGQALDMLWTARSGYGREDLDAIHRHKTGCLIEASCVMGAIAAGATREQQSLLAKFGAHVGLAFQIIDDLLDTKTAIGKTTGKDAASGKLTYLSLMSPAEAEDRAQTLTETALACLEALPGSKEPLLALAQQLLTRQK